ncbi:sciellin isoform 3-T3 [Rhynchonycteris naso]
MSDFTLRKTSPTGKAMKSTAQGATQRQQGFLEVNKRRTFLQDNSWIKNRPEEERDENYGRVVLNRHNSHDALDRTGNQKNEQRAMISRYRSDDTLDRISDRHDATKTFKANTSDNQLTNRHMSTFRSPEATKMQPGGFLGANTTGTPTSTSATTPVKKKRQSWFPPPPPGYGVTPSTGGSRREPGVHPPLPPKPSSPVLSPNQLRRDNRQICPPKADVYAETNRSAERNISEDLDNIIKMNKSLNRNQGLDGIFRTTPKAEKAEKRAQSLESLIFLNTRTNKDGKGNQTLDSFIKENPRMVKSDKGKQDLNGRIKVNPETNKDIKRGQSLDNLIKVTPEVNRSNSGFKDLDNLIKVNARREKHMQGGQSLDSFIKVAPEANRTNQRNQDLNNVIKVTPSANKSKQGLEEINISPKSVKNMAGNQSLDNLIKVNPETLTNNRRNQDLDKLIKVKPAAISNQSQDLDNLIKVKPSALRNMERDRELDNLIEVNSNVYENKNERKESSLESQKESITEKTEDWSIRETIRRDGQVSGSTDALHSLSTRTTAQSYETRKNFSSSADTSPAGPKDTVVYTRTYVENSKSPKDSYPEDVSRRYIQTVYSTSDRSIIERDMCTYCRKPLGTNTKMILDELQICCHSTCFKCEICKRSLENLQAGDSIWIYRKTIHCEPCYSKVVAKWIQ